MKSKLLRKVGWSVLAASSVLVLTALLVPLFVDVDQYRPRLVTEVNRRIRGKLELGKLQLSLWGRIRVGIEGLKLVDSRGRVLVQVKDAWFGVPVSSLFAGAPELTLHLGQPEIQVAKDRSGGINLLQVLPTEPAQTVPADVAAEAPTGASSGPVELPAVLVRARFGLDIRDAQASYRDEATALAFQVKALDVRVKDLSLSQPTLFEVRAGLSGRMGKLFEMHGPAKLSGRVETQIEAGKLQGYSAQAKADLSAVAIEVPGAFIKKEGVPAQADLRLVGNLQSVQLEALQAQFHNVKVSGSGALQLASSSAPAKLKLAIQVPLFDLSEWTALLPALQGTGLQGKVGLEAGAEGPVDAFQYRASVQMADLGAKVPGLKAMPTFSGDVKVRTDQVESFQWVMKAPGTDLTLSGSVMGFTAPKIQAQFTSRSGMDFDQWVDWNYFAEKKKAELAAAAKATPAGAASGDSGGAQLSPADDLDAMLAPLRQLEPARRASGTIQASLPLIQAYGVRMTAAQTRLQLKELAMVMDPFSMQVFDGKVSAKASMDLKPKAPTYQFSAQVDGIQLSKAVESQLQLFKNTLLGNASFNIQGSGSSFNPEPAMRNLNAKGSLKVTNATFATLDIGRMAAEAVNRAVEQVGQKVPMLKGMALRTPPGKDSRYDWIASDFTISGGVFQAPNFATQAATGYSVDLKGATRLGLLDLALKADWEVIDTHNVLKARDLSVKVAGTDVPHVLAQGDGPVRFPVSVSGTATAPQYSTLQVPEYLAKVAGENLAKAAGSRAKAEVKQRAVEALENAAQKAAPALKNALKGLFGR